MTDKPCARPGCGAPKAWHGPDDSMSLDSLFGGEPWARNDSHMAIVSRPWVLAPGQCIGYYCPCVAYVAPEPPTLKAYVFESSAATRMPSGEWALPSGHVVIPLDEYLAAHPQPAPVVEREAAHCPLCGVRP